MKKIATTIRCVPRFGYSGTEVRSIDLELPDSLEDEVLLEVLRGWFALRGLPDAVYDLRTDDHGHLAVINDEAYAHDWGTPLL